MHYGMNLFLLGSFMRYLKIYLLLMTKIEQCLKRLNNPNIYSFLSYKKTDKIVLFLETHFKILFKTSSTETCNKPSNHLDADSPIPIKKSQLYPSTSEMPPHCNQHSKQDHPDPILKLKFDWYHR